ncbi:DNA polymerase III subunit chi [Allopontixanthobacter sediminis]|uniref:DNA polymerase III subunit chi n=1 Tax=Allopontixanthobacter sediminis TaxID=1689985 RepID=A0A845AUD2_9SPHN|nr:DNA polymerase III subunit chi [Allopontixanthobacter sediminis]MXP43153.1 DNA polymerase III subunit chi [Allopontixanthobacter sediminis]
MRVDFYLLDRDPAEAVVPLLARAAKQAGERVLVVSGDAEQRMRIDQALWTAASEAFLAHGTAGEGHENRQPVLISAEPAAANKARFVILADGKWREESAGFDRVFLLFGEDRRQEARECWTALGKAEAMERHFWKQDGGKWREMG